MGRVSIGSYLLNHARSGCAPLCRSVLHQHYLDPASTARSCTDLSDVNHGHTAVDGEDPKHYNRNELIFEPTTDPEPPFAAGEAVGRSRELYDQRREALGV